MDIIQSGFLYRPFYYLSGVVTMRFSIEAVVCVSLVLLFAGCISGDTSGPTTSTVKGKVTNQTKMGQPNTRPTMSTLPRPPLKDQLSDMKEAIASRGNYICNYSVDGVSTQAWLNVNKSRTKTRESGPSQFTINNGHWLFVWREGSREGTRFNLTRIYFAKVNKTAELNRELADSRGYMDMEDVAAKAIGVDCKVSNVPFSMFNQPLSVVFIDVTDMVLPASPMMPQIPD